MKKNIFIYNDRLDDVSQRDWFIQHIVSNYDANVYIDIDDADKCEHIIFINDGGHDDMYDPLNISFNNKPDIDLAQFESIWSTCSSVENKMILMHDNCDTRYDCYYTISDEFGDYSIEEGTGELIIKLESNIGNNLLIARSFGMI